MAVDLGTIRAIVEADTGGFDSAMSGVADASDSAGDSFDSVSDGALDASDNIEHVGDGAENAADGLGNIEDGAGSAADGMNDVSDSGQGASDTLGLFSPKGAAIAGAVAGALLLKKTLETVSGAMKAIIFDTAATGDSLDKTSQQIGVSAEALQRLTFAAGQSGVSASRLENVMARTSRQIGEASREGGIMAEMYDEFGVAFENAGGGARDAEQVFLDAADAISQMEDPIAQADAAANLFGRRGGQELLPMLREGRDGVEALGLQFEDLGGMMDEHGIAASVAFTDAMGRMDAVSNGVKNTLGGLLLPAATEVVNVIVALVQEVSSFLPAGQGMSEMITAIVRNGLVNMLTATIDLTERIGRFASALLPASDTIATVGQVIMGAVRAMQVWDESIKVLFKIIRGFVVRGVGALLEGLSRLIDMSRDLFNKLPARIRAAIPGADAVGAALEGASDAAAGLGESIDQMGRNIHDSAAEDAAALEERIEQMKDAFTTDRSDDVEELLRGIVSGSQEARRRLGELTQQIREGDFAADITIDSEQVASDIEDAAASAEAVAGITVEPIHIEESIGDSLEAANDDEMSVRDAANDDLEAGLLERQKREMEARDNAMTAMGDTLMGALKSFSPDLASVFEGAKGGFDAGSAMAPILPVGAGAAGAAGAAIAVAGELWGMAKETEEFKRLTSVVSDKLKEAGIELPSFKDLLGKAVEAFSPAIVGMVDVFGEFKDALSPLKDLFGNIFPEMASVQEMLFDGMKSFSIVVLKIVGGIAQVIAHVTNGFWHVIDKINKAVSLIPGIDGPLDDFLDKIGNVRDKFQETSDNMDEAVDNVRDMEFDDAKDSLDNFQDSVDKATNSMSNVPTVFRRALRAGQSSERDDSFMDTLVGEEIRFSGNYFTVVANDPEELMNKMKRRRWVEEGSSQDDGANRRADIFSSGG